jgi:glutamine amidotransferase
MCRLLGITNFEFSKHQQIVLNFCELARSGMVMKGDPPGHADGWGVAFYQNGELEVYKSGGNLLEETDQALELLAKPASARL